jgi:pSer/pThr/pTyr-binding forkhead associated (FHA) protein
MTGSSYAALCYTNDSGEPQCVPLEESRPRLLIGRSDSCDVVVGWDATMSREHAIIEHIGAHWFVSDDGMSTHGTYIQPERAGDSRSTAQVRGRRRLEANDQLLLGQTLFTFRAPLEPGLVPTKTTRRPAPVLTPAQERVLAVLCAPLRDDPLAMPASNQQIANELYIGLDAVKDHLQVLYKKFGVQDLPRVEKRIRLAHLAIQTGRI